MRKSMLFLSLLGGISSLLNAQGGKVFDNLSMKSQILDSERKYAVYLPPDYETSGRSYPVLYLLHGGGDDQTGWVQFGEVLYFADKTVADGSSTAMIIVMPDANTGQRGFFNSISGDWRYEDFFFEEFIPFIEKTYRIKSEKRYRAISGLSMGGGGALVYALHHPELFSSSCPLSASVGPLSLEEAKTRYIRNDARVKDAEIEKYFNRHSAVSLINNLPADDLKRVRWFIDCGDDDRLSEGNCLVHLAMMKKEITHEFRIRNGAHNWTYWRESLPVVLSFVSDAFHQY